MNQVQIEEANGKLGVLVVGLNGAVSTTFVAGTIAIRKGFSKPIGSLTQMATIRIGARVNNEFPMIKDFVPLADLDDIVFGGWDIHEETLLDSLQRNKVLLEKDYINLKEDLDQIHPMSAAFDQNYVHRLEGDYIKEAENKYETAMQLRADIQNFKHQNELDRVVVIWCASTEIFIEKSKIDGAN